MNKSCHTHGYVMSHSWISHATLTNMSIHTWMSDFTHGGVISNMNESCHTYQRFIDPTLRVVMNESCHVWMSHVTYEWGMSRMNEACHVWMSHVMYEWGMSRMNESCHTYQWFIDPTLWVCAISQITYEWVMSPLNVPRHIRMIHVTHTNQSHQIHYEGVMSRMNESCHVWMNDVTYEWIMSRMHESCHPWTSHVMYAWVMSHIWISHTRYVRDESYHV